MDQLEMLQQFETRMQRFEKVVNQQFTALEENVQKAYLNHVTKYGDTLAEAVKYNRLGQLTKQVDQAATATYSELTKSTQSTTEEEFNKMYLAYAYLLYATMSDEEGEYLPITETFAASSAAVAVALLLLSSKKKVWLDFQKEQADLRVIFTKHKNDYVYNVTQDIRDSLLKEVGASETAKQIKKRTLNARLFGINRIDDVTNYVVNYVQDKIYELASTFTEQQKARKQKADKGKTPKLPTVDKMWVSMRDKAVRFAHRILDSQFADAEGYFHYMGDKAKRPKTWKDPNMNWGCRCKVLLLLNGRLPRSTKVSNYQDKTYQTALSKRIRELQTKENKTYIQAYQIATKEIKPPQEIVKGYMSHEEWLKKYGD